MTTPLPSHGVPALWSRDMAADMARVQRDEAQERAFAAETARLIEERRDEAERALIAARWGDGETWETMDLHERADAGRLVVAAVLLLAVAVVAAVWIGWALAAHVGELWQAAEAAVERGAM